MYIKHYIFRFTAHSRITDIKYIRVSCCAPSFVAIVFIFREFLIKMVWKWSKRVVCVIITEAVRNPHKLL